MPVGRDGSNTFSVITGALAAAVGNGGTFAPAYPSGKDKSNFFLAMAHKLTIGSDVYYFPVDFDISLGATTVTVTNKSTTITWPAGATFRLQLMEQGERAMLTVPLQDPNNQTIVVGTTQAYGVDARSKLIPSTTAGFADLVTLGAPAALATNNVCLAQSIASSGALLVNGALATSGVATMDVPRALQAVSTGADTAVLTVTGTDVYSQVMKENLTLNGTTVVTGKKAFKTVTGISASIAIANLCSVGTTDILGLPVFLPSAANVVGEIRNGVPVGPAGASVTFVVNQTDFLAKTTQETVSPIAGSIRRLSITPQLTIVKGAPITLKVGTTAVTGFSIQPADNAVPGATQTQSVVNTDGTDVVAAGSRIQVLIGASAATSGAFNGNIYIAGLDGTVVAGMRTGGGSTATTADVRGTYQPGAACDGTPVQLLCILPDRYAGAKQFGS